MKNENRQKLVVIAGPTASGKTGLARALAREFGGFIISADSRQVYRYLDIGAGKADTNEELLSIHKQREVLDSKWLVQGLVQVSNLNQQIGNQRTGGFLECDAYICYILNSIPHYMIDIIDPREEYNVALYQKDIYQLFNSKLKTKNSKMEGIPFLVGGTGQYIDAVVDNWQFPKGEPNYGLRRELEEQGRRDGLDGLWKELLARDPDCALFVQKENARRVARALEYAITTGEKFSKARRKGERQFDVLKLGISLPREELYKKIDARVDARICLGMIDEVRELNGKHGLSYERLKQFGLEYRAIAEFLTGGFSSESEMIQRLKWDIHGFARRQMTWFRKDKEIQWVNSVDGAMRRIMDFLADG